MYYDSMVFEQALNKFIRFKEKQGTNEQLEVFISNDDYIQILKNFKDRVITTNNTFNYIYKTHPDAFNELIKDDSTILDRVLEILPLAIVPSIITQKDITRIKFYVWIEYEFVKDKVNMYYTIDGYLETINNSMKKANVPLMESILFKQVRK